MTATLIYPPVRDGYGFTPGYGYIETKLNGGASRVRKDIQDPAHTIQANWVLKETEYTEFMGFFHSTLQEATLPFLVELLGDLSVLTTHKARCVQGGRPKLTANRGNAFYVTATLEVENNSTYTGTMNFAINLPGFPARINASPKVLSQYQVLDSVRVHRAIPAPTNPSFNFDGTYVITGLPGASIIEMLGAPAVNTAWNVLDPGNVDIPCTITRVPT